MKTFKIAIIAAFLAFSLMSMANQEAFMTKKSKIIIEVTIQQALGDPGLVAAMYQQLNPDFLGSNQQSYTLSVDYLQYTFRISGTHAEWKLFFTPKWKFGSEKKLNPIES